MLPRNFEGKRSLIDVRCKDKKGREFIIEMQNPGNSKTFIQRSQVYSAQILVNQIRRGEEYGGIMPIIVLIIADYDIKPEDKHHLNFYEMQNKDKSGNKCFDLVSYAVVNLVRYRENRDSGKLIVSSEYEKHWLDFISDAPKKTSLPAGAPQSVIHAYDKVEKALWSEEALNAYHKDQDAKMVYESSMKQIRLEGRAEGEKIGEERGRAEGEERGRAEERMELAKALLADGMDASKVGQVGQMLGLSVEAMEKLK